jgi:cell division protein DivIC
MSNTDKPELQSLENKVSTKKKNEEKVRNIGFLITLLVLVAITPLMMKFYDVYNSKRTTYQEKIKEEQHLRQEVEHLKKKTENMTKKEEYLKTDEGVESVAREKLGLTKPNEIPIVLKNNKETRVEEITTKVDEITTKDELDKKDND